MPITPFTFNPAGPFDRLNAYFFCTWMRISYFGEPSPNRDQLRDLVGADEVVIHEGNGVQHTEVANIPGQGALVFVRGTDDNLLLIRQILARQQIDSDDHEGAVHGLHLQLSTAVWDAIQNSLPPVWTAAGHSLGGAIADLISDFGATRLFTAGCPRVGNLEYALSRNSAMHLRLTNAEDIVARIPLSSGSDFFDDLGLPPIPAIGFPGQEFFRHWGTRINLFSDGTATRPPEVNSLLDLTGALDAARGNPAGVLVNHFVHEYTRRVRSQIPIRFPADVPDDEIVGLFELDQINESLNDQGGVTWEIDGRESFSLLRLLRIMNRQYLAQSQPGSGDYPFLCE